MRRRDRRWLSDTLVRAYGAWLGLAVFTTVRLAIPALNPRLLVRGGPTPRGITDPVWACGFTAGCNSRPFVLLLGLVLVAAAGLLGFAALDLAIRTPIWRARVRLDRGALIAPHQWRFPI